MAVVVLASLNSLGMTASRTMSFAKEVQLSKAPAPAIGANGVNRSSVCFKRVKCPYVASSPTWVSREAAGTTSVLNEVQFEKAREPMLVMAVGSVSSTRAEQPLKVPLPILESAAGRVSLRRRLQRVKANWQIFASVTAEKSTLVREEQLNKTMRQANGGDEGRGECEGRGVRAECTQKRRNRRCW